MNLQLIFPNGESVCGEIENPYRGNRGGWTPYGHTCEYKDYYEFADWSHYIRVDKNSLSVTSNARDVNRFQPCETKAKLMTDEERNAYYSV